MTAAAYPPLQSLLAREARFMLDSVKRKRPLLGAEAADLDVSIAALTRAVEAEENAWQEHVKSLLARDEYEKATASEAAWMGWMRKWRWGGRGGE